jgi:hypothetical protein
MLLDAALGTTARAPGQTPSTDTQEDHDLLLESLAGLTPATEFPVNDLAGAGG